MTNDEIKQKLFEITTGLNKVGYDLFKKKELNAYVCIVDAVKDINNALEEIYESEKKRK